VARRVAFAKRGGWLARLRYRRPARFIAISPAAAAPLAALHVPASKIAIVPDGVPLLPESSRNPDCVVAPGGGKGRELLAEAARLAGVPIHFSSDLESDLARAALFLYASDAEGLGSAALLAQSASVPVVASDIPGLRAAVEPDVSGLLVPNSAPAFAAALRRLLDDSPAAHRMGRAGRRRVEQSFTIDAMVDRTVEVYRAVMGR
jgi:glycosyltransferase involved in cell wall biosynthesis